MKSHRRRAFESAAVLCAAAVCILVFYREFFLSGFNLITGDPGDARLYIVVLEHWRAVAAGRAAFASPNFFAPFHGALGYSDALFLYAPPFVFLRWLGCDPFLAFQITLILVRLTGFFALYALLKKLGLGLLPALAGASLFTVAHISFYSSGHPQLDAVAFVPLIALLLFHYFEHPAGRAWSLWAGAALFGLLFLTGYYIAFFCVLAGAALLAAWIFLHVVERRAFSGRAHWLDLAIAMAIFAAALTPALIVYLPALHGTGGRSFADIQAFLQSGRALFDVSPTNWIWGRWMSRLYADPVFQHGETSQGFTPVSVLLAAIAFYWAMRGWRPGHLRICILTTGIACALLYAVSVSYVRWTPWYFVFRFVPGGSAIRVPNRINHLIALGIAILCAAALQRMMEWPARRILGVLGAAALACFLFLEQGDALPQAHIDRAAEIRFLQQVPAPPASCTAFFVTDPRIPTPDLIGQIDAMLIAREKGIPTLDGYSGWAPRGWRLGSLQGDVAKTADAYAEANGIRAGLCEFDERTMQWSPAPER